MQSIISGKGLPPLNTNIGYMPDMTLKSKPNTTRRNNVKGCKYCNDELEILSSEIEILDDIFITFSKDDDHFSSKYIKQFYETEKLRVFYDRGYLRLTKGNDIGCLDHSEDRVRINYCPMCGRKLS